MTRRPEPPEQVAARVKRHRARHRGELERYRRVLEWIAKCSSDNHARARAVAALTPSEPPNPEQEKAP